MRASDSRRGVTLAPPDLFLLEQQRILSRTDSLLLVRLLYLCWSNGGSTKISLKGLIRAFGWRWTDEWLRRTLHRLTSMSLIEAQPPGRGAKDNEWSIKFGSAWDLDSKGHPLALSEEWVDSVGAILGAPAEAEHARPDEEPRIRRSRGAAAQPYTDVVEFSVFGEAIL